MTETQERIVVAHAAVLERAVVLLTALMARDLPGGEQEDFLAALQEKLGKPVASEQPNEFAAMLYADLAVEMRPIAERLTAAVRATLAARR